MLAVWPIFLLALVPTHGSRLRELDARTAAAYIVSNASDATKDAVTLAAHSRGAHGYPNPPKGFGYNNQKPGEIPEWGVCNGDCKATPKSTDCKIITKGESATQEFVNANTKFANWLACFHTCCSESQKETGPIVRQITDTERTGGLYEEDIRFDVCEQADQEWFSCNEKWAEDVLDMTTKMARSDHNLNPKPPAVTGLGENGKCLGVCQRYPDDGQCAVLIQGVPGDIEFIDANAKLAEWLMCFADCCALDLNRTTVVNRIADWDKTGTSAETERMLREELCMTGIQHKHADCNSGTAQRIEQYIQFMTQGEMMKDNSPVAQAAGSGLTGYELIAKNASGVQKGNGLLLHTKAKGL